MMVCHCVQTPVEGAFYACWFADYVLQVDGENVSPSSYCGHDSFFLIGLLLEHVTSPLFSTQDYSIAACSTQ